MKQESTSTSDITEESLFLEKEETTPAAPSSSSASSSSSSSKKQSKKSKKVILKEEPIEEEEEENQEEADDEFSADDFGTTQGHGTSRQWQKDETFNNQSGYCISVGITTRDESLPIYDTPCKMYSSLRYKLQYKCVIVTSGISTPSTPKLLMCRVTVIDEETGKEIKKDNKPIIDDSLISLKCTSSNSSAGQSLVFEANHKIKFKSVSFHHNKSKWRILLQLFSDSNQSINTPVLVIKSAPFQVYARRPKVSERDATNGLLSSTAPSSSTSSQQKEDKKKKKKNELKKRKRSASMAGKDLAPQKLEKQETSTIVTEGDCSSPLPATTTATPSTSTTTASTPATVEPTTTATPTPETKTQSIENKAALKQKKKLMDNFTKTLETLLKYHSEMDEDNRKVAFEMIQQRMYSHFYNELVQQQEWMASQMAAHQESFSPENIETDHGVTTLQAGSADDLITNIEQCAESSSFNETSIDTENDCSNFLTMCEINSNSNGPFQNCGSYEMDTLMMSTSDFPHFI